MASMFIEEICVTSSGRKQDMWISCCPLLTSGDVLFHCLPFLVQPFIFLQAARMMAFKPLSPFLSCWSCDLIPQKYPVDIGIQWSDSLTALQVLQPQAAIIVWERTLTQFSTTFSLCSKSISDCISFHPEPTELQWGKRDLSHGFSLWELCWHHSCLLEGFPWI